ncbi:hypothetical protein [Deinococcus aquaedulcis]|uniref:hypothetical protein n=1 Tax=Deinococcus aquaedulcis TaxID=2840455 RepID=UPI001C83FDC7|nr:hypothetical protein [Deinococcus aquaedulcis]
MRALFLLPALFLAACAPAATGPEDLKGPLVEGERWTITGFDQNNNKMNGEVVVPAEPDYDRTDREWLYSSARASILYTESSNWFSVWDERDASRLVICIVRSPYNAVTREYSGIGVSGTMEELRAVFAKLSGTGVKVVGGDCTVKREAKN